MEIQEFFDGILEGFGSKNCSWGIVGQTTNEMQVVEGELCSYILRMEKEDEVPMAIELKSFNYKKREIQSSPKLMKYINKCFGCPVCSFHYVSDFVSISDGVSFEDAELLVFVWGIDKKAIADLYKKTAFENPNKVHDLEIAVF